MLMLGAAVMSASMFTACDDDDDYNTNPIKGGVSLTAALTKVTRGGYMQFKGSGLDQVQTVIFPENVEVSEIEKVDNFTIRCLVPEAAEPGVVKLVAGETVLETEPISFTEPIKFVSLSAESMKAGDEITVTGENVDHIQFVRFATGEQVKVTLLDRRTKFKFIVPLTASTGELVMGYNEEVDGESIANELPCQNVVVAAPEAVGVKTLTDVMPGDVITIEGKNLDLVEAISVLGEEDTKEFTYEDGKITFKATQFMQEGQIILVAYSGLTYTAHTIVPKAAKITAAVVAKNGQTVAVESENAQLISTILFGETPAEFKVAEGVLSVTIPETAESGNITVVSNSLAKSVVEFTTVKPVNAKVSVWPLPATEEVTFTGTDLDLVKSIVFPSGEEVEVKTIDAANFSVVVPITAKTDGVQPTKVIMKNGEVVEDFQYIEVKATEYCFIPELQAEVTPGLAAQFAVVNGDALTEVLINGESVHYMFAGVNNDLFVFFPISMQGKTVNMTLISADKGEKAYKVKVAPMGEVITPVYEETVVLEGWNNNEMQIDFASAPEGARLRLFFTVTDPENPAAQIYDGHWGMVFAAKSDGTEVDLANIEEIKSKGVIDLPLDLFPYSDWGYSMIMQGQGLKVDKIAFVQGSAAQETEIFKGPLALASWDSHEMSNDQVDFSGVPADATVRIYVDCNDESGMNIFDGHWGKLYEIGGAGDAAIFDQMKADGYFELTMAELPFSDWGYTIILQGENITVKSIVWK